ncbi:CHD5 domain protein [Ceratobasidium sp. AG-Ba]|nr:CHD5 domain protein [Ceratobasidium sp. AG-Ba]
MGTSGFRGYLHKRRYYTTYHHWDAYPEGLGDWFAAKIPRDEDEREAWIQCVIQEIELELLWRHDNNISDDEDVLDVESVKVEYAYDEYELLRNGQPVSFQGILKHTEQQLLPRMAQELWTYVIDLDSRAFTINGVLHFRLDNMPPGELNSHFWWTYDEDGKASRQILVHPPHTPIEYIATVARWPLPKTDPSLEHDKYVLLNPALISIHEWGAPSWTTLSIPQQLCADLVQTILLDHAQTLSNPDLTGEEYMRYIFGVCCWQLLSATAPCLLELPDEGPEDPAFCHSISRLSRNNHYNCITPYYKPDLEYSYNPYYSHLDHWYLRFRGCLVVFVPRLDVPECVEYEVVHMVEQLRSYGRTHGTGIIFAGRHILAVSVDGDLVRRSPTLLFHDAKMQCQEGFLLVTHLLSPPCFAHRSSNPPSTEEASISPNLPKEIIQNILFNLDHETWHSIQFVSKRLREIYLQYPRVGEHILLNYVGDGKYNVFDTVSGYTSVMHLQRVDIYGRHNDLSNSFQLAATTLFTSHGPLIQTSSVIGSRLQSHETKLNEKNLIRQIEEELSWRHDHDIEDGEDLLQVDFVNLEYQTFELLREAKPIIFCEILDPIQGQLIPGYGEEEWTYVIDLDSRAFTINGVMHFCLDNMPPGTLNSHFWWMLHRSESSCIPTFAHPPRTPIEHIAKANRWPSSQLDLSFERERHSKNLSALKVTNDWGAPSWNTLSVAQQLSANLAQTILVDHAQRLSNPDLVGGKDPDTGSESAVGNC